MIYAHVVLVRNSNTVMEKLESDLIIEVALYSMFLNILL